MTTPHLLKAAETHWPYPLAVTCRALRVKSRWEESQGVACHLFELMLRHTYALVLTEYGYLKHPSQRIAQYLMARAYRGNLTCGSMIEGLREVAPYVAGYAHETHMPELFEALCPKGDFLDIDTQILSPLNALRIQWSHPKGHVAYNPPRQSDYTRFYEMLLSLVERLDCFGNYPMLYTQQLTRLASGWKQRALLLQGAVTPFETVDYALNLHDKPPENHSVVIAMGQNPVKLVSLAPFYMGRSDASGHCELAALVQLRKKRCAWDPAWPAEAEGAAHRAYNQWMERFTLPEIPEAIATVTPPAVATPEPTHTAKPQAAPVFRNANWRMFAMDWPLETTALYNEPHYDALMYKQQLLAVWRYVPEENAYLLGLRPRLAKVLAPEQACQILQTCPVSYQHDFAPEHRGHWHHSHYHWFYMPHQNALGDYLTACDTICRNSGGTF